MGFDRYAYVYNNPVKYNDPTGYFSEDQIKEFFGLTADDPWEEVLKFFEVGGKYEGRWGWLEILRRAEIGDKIRIDWAENVLPGGHPAIGETLTFGINPYGELILSGEAYYFGHEIAVFIGRATICFTILISLSWLVHRINVISKRISAHLRSMNPIYIAR